MKDNIAVFAFAVGLLCPMALPAQTQTANLNPAYLNEMPTVERVMSAMQASDPDETAARQMGAFWQLKKMIEDMAGPRLYDRKNGLTPYEERLRQAYYAAYYRIQQSKAEYKSFKAMRAYDVSPQFRAELLQKLFPPHFAAVYAKATGQANAQFDAVHQARIQREQEQIQALQAEQAERARNEEENRKAALDVTRCLSTGKSELECSLRTFGKGVNDALGGMGLDPNAAKAPKPTFTFYGEYPGPEKLLLKFASAYEANATLTCGELAEIPLPYKISVKPNSVAVQIPNGEQSVTFFLTPDERLAGPGPTNVHGRVIVGWRSAPETTVWRSATGDTQNYPDSAHPYMGTKVSPPIPIYKPKTERCTLGALASNGKVGTVAVNPRGTAGGVIETVGGVLTGRKPGSFLPAFGSLVNT